MITHIQQESRACLTQQQRTRLDELLLELDTRKLGYWLGDTVPGEETPADHEEPGSAGLEDGNPSLEKALFETAGLSTDITDELAVLTSYSDLVLDDDFMQTYRTLLKFTDRANKDGLTEIAISTIDEMKAFLTGSLVDSQVEVISAFDFYRNSCERLLELPKSDRNAVILPDLGSSSRRSQLFL
ncbi:hypothetical protein KY362_01385 [Candidatus Woesearchaeota archaeon]|nr:hypothetical protein [Candidatus Woesearchaeota archaeon]